MAFTPETFVLCSKFNLFKAHANLWIYSTADTLEDCLEPDYFQPRRNIKNQDSPEVGDVIQLIVENSKLAYLKIVAKTEKPYNITVERTYLENEGLIFEEIAKKADKTENFVTPITDENAGITQAEQAELEDKIDLAANSGRMLTAQGFWYAKMHSETVAPSAEDGTNYADFSQVDGEGNPIIVTYNRVSGAWVQDQTITPPAEFDGYVPITSKIWDITEQDGQQGGRILWNHTSKQFTPYPTIVTFDDVEIDGNSTVNMPANPTGDNIVNVNYVTNQQNFQNMKPVTFVAGNMTISFSHDKTIYYVSANANTAITLDISSLSLAADTAQTFEVHIICGGSVPQITWNGIDNWLVGSNTSPTEANKTSIYAIRVQKNTNSVTTVVANYGGAY